MATGGELYEPIATGLTLLFSVTWFSIFDQVLPTTLANGLRETGQEMIENIYSIIAYWVAIGFGLGFVYPAYRINQMGGMGNKTHIDLLVESFFLPIEILIGFLSWIPLEVGVVAFALAFLHIVTGGEDYATN